MATCVPREPVKIQRIRPRYEDYDHPIRLKTYMQHRARVESAKPFVDSKPPMVGKRLYSSPTNFNRSVSTFVRIETENARMLRRIATIMEGESGLDNKHTSTLKSSFNRSRARQMQLLQITFDNLKMFQRIESTQTMYSRKKQLQDYEKYEKVMELNSAYPLFWKVPPPMAWDSLAGCALENAVNNPRPRVFLDLESDKEVLGQVIIELRADVVPFTAENFRALCTGERGLSYKCTEIHRIIPNILWQGGDVSGKEGRGCGRSIYGETFPDENFKLKHSEAGIVSMVNAGKDTNASQFLITAKKLDALNGVNVVVGKVICGKEVLDQVTSLITPSGRPKYRVWIANCGQVDEDGGESTDPNGSGKSRTADEDEVEGTDADEEDV